MTPATPKKPNFTGTISGVSSPSTNSISTGQLTTGASYNGTYSLPTASWQSASYTISSTPNYTTASRSGNSVVIFHDDLGNKIVSLEANGDVIWHKPDAINEAAEAFSKSIKLGAEIQTKITKSVKLNMRDSVFNSLIEIAKDKGPLSADELTSLLEASKIIEKLKGGNDE